MAWSRGGGEGKEEVDEQAGLEDAGLPSPGETLNSRQPHLIPNGYTI